MTMTPIERDECRLLDFLLVLSVISLTGCGSASLDQAVVSSQGRRDERMNEKSEELWVDDFDTAIRMQVHKILKQA